MMRWISALFFFSFFIPCNSYAQQTGRLERKDSMNELLPHRNVESGANKCGVAGVTVVNFSPPDFNKRKRLVGGVTAGAYAGAFAVLSTVWYQQYDRTGFHTFDDAGEWLQMDKLGHAWFTYYLNGLSTGAWGWAGLPEQQAVLAGSITTMGFVTIIELLDAYSAKWGWSWADVGANVFGTSLFALQQLHWKEQRIRYKFSVHFKEYPTDLKQRSDDIFGATVAQKLLKDYNAQTYWLSTSLRSFFPRSGLPAWLNVSAGYSAEGMLGGFENIGFDDEGKRTFYRPDIRRYRQWYLAPDIDLSKIRTKSKVLRTVFTVFSSFKFPAPTLEFSKGRFRGRWVHF